MDSVSNQLLMGGISGPVTGQVILSDRRNWVVPTGVTSICVVAVGRGGFTVSGSTAGSGGGGGGLGDAGDAVGIYGFGAVRIIWGPNRAFPSTNTGDM